MMPAVDQEFRGKVNAYNQAHHTQKIWAAGVLPGYNDKKVPGRKFTYTVQRSNGARIAPVGLRQWPVTPSGSPSPPSTNGSREQ